MKLAEKTTLEIHRELTASGVFIRNTQAVIAQTISVDQGTISRIANGDFKRVNKSVRAVCKYAKISTVKSSGTAELRSLVASAATLSDPEKRKLAGIIGLAVDLLERS